MGKRTAGKKQTNFTNRRAQETDDEDIYDEVDRFHKMDRILKTPLNLDKTSDPIEVLNVEGDDDDVSDPAHEHDDDASMESDWDDAPAKKDIEDLLPSREDWGKKRSNFYSTNQKDKTRLGDEDEEEDDEDAELEEEDARARQRYLDQAAAYQDIYDELDKDTVEVAEITDSTAKKWNATKAQKLNKETARMLNDYKLKAEMFEVIIKPLLEVAAALPEGSPLKFKLKLSANAYGTYLATLQFWLALKAESIRKRNETEVMVDRHPALEKIAILKKMTDKIDSFVARNSELFSKLIQKARNGKNVDIEAHYPILSQKKVLRQNEHAMMSAENLDDEGKDSFDEDNADEMSRREISYSIEKNKAQNYKKKKNARNSKVKKRQQFKKAVQRQNSQRPKLRKEDSRYSGEARGIRISTIKSVQLKA